MDTENFRMVAKTFQGLEDVLSEELIGLGAENVEIGTRMVSFEGDNSILYKANLCCRTALRILKPIVMFTARDTDELYDYLRDLQWEKFMDADSTFAVDSTVYGPEFNHSRFVTYRVKDAIVDHFRDLNGKRPSIRLDGADLIFNVHIADDRVTISLDSSGDPLYKRGYRVAQTDAPINEVLAAGIILKTGWRGDSDFLDPMCGSGTFLIEAALIAANINPGIYREKFAFEKWSDFDKNLFEEIYNDDSEEREFNYKIYGGDIDADAIAIAQRNVKSARVEDMVSLTRKSFSEWTDLNSEGIMVTNPPYGERLRPENINSLYKELGTALKRNFAGWHAWIIGYKDEQMSEIGLKPSVKIPLFNGSLECSLREYVMFDGSYNLFKADGGSVDSYASEKKKSEGPRKVKHISDDDWQKESRKFNRDSGFKGKDSRDRGFKDRDSRDSRDSRDRGFKDRDSRGSRDRGFKDRDSRDSRDRGFKDRDSRDSRDRGFKDRDSRDSRDRGFKDRDSRDSRDRGFKDRDSKDSRDRGFKDRDSRDSRDRGFKSKDNFKRDFKGNKGR